MTTLRILTAQLTTRMAPHRLRRRQRHHHLHRRDPVGTETTVCQKNKVMAP